MAIVLTLNALGSNIVLTDDDQNVLARYEYDVFGAIRNETGTSDNTRKFTGKEFDADSNLYYYAARYYDPYNGESVPYCSDSTIEVLDEEHTK